MRQGLIENKLTRHGHFPALGQSHSVRKTIAKGKAKGVMRKSQH